MGTYRKLGHGRYRGNSRTVSLRQIRARYYFAKHRPLRTHKKRKKQRL